MIIHGHLILYIMGTEKMRSNHCLHPTAYVAGAPPASAEANRYMV